jgi:hypothetical protein
MARARVADFERNLDETPGGFADELLISAHAKHRCASASSRPKKSIIHFHLVNLAWIHSFQRKELDLFGGVFRISCETLWGSVISQD